jgi:hypothetical protein
VSHVVGGCRRQRGRNHRARPAAAVPPVQARFDDGSFPTICGNQPSSRRCLKREPRSGRQVGALLSCGPPQLNFDLKFDILDVLLPVTVEAITTKTAATTIATIQRTQSTPEVAPPPKAA